MILSNQKCEIQPTFIKLHTNGHSQELHHYPFAVKLVRIELNVSVCFFDTAIFLFECKMDMDINGSLND